MNLITATDFEGSTALARCLLDPEYRLVERIVRGLSKEGRPGDLFQIVNFYVALKSKPLVILVGPEHTGKCELIRQVGRELTGGELTQFQMMIGHAWWAARSENLSEFTRMQERFIAEKARALLYEACHPDNLKRIFILSIDHISPAELAGFFADLAFQLQRGELRHLLSASFSASLPFPPNLHVIGTLDTPLYNWYDDTDLLAQATVIHWHSSERIASVPFRQAPCLTDVNSFDTVYTRRVRGARRKLGKFPGWREYAQPTLIKLVGWLVKHGASLPTRIIMDEATIYLANAFTEQRVGLFVPEASQNLRIALDFVLAQVVLPRTWEALSHSSMLREVLYDQLEEGFLHTRWMVEQSAAG